MEILIRTYRPEDENPFKQSIAQLQEYERGFGIDMLPGDEMADAWFRYTIEETKQKGGEIYVAEVDNRAVGFMSLRVEPSSAEEDLYCKPATSVFVYDLHISPGFRGNGIGKRLLSKADEYAVKRNIPYIKLQVFAGNTHGRAVYQALGYQEVAVTMVKQITN